MPKSIIRIVALLLVPALIADPVMVSAFVTYPIDTSVTAPSSTGIFCQEALIARRLGYERAMDFITTPFRSLSKLIRIRKAPIPQPTPSPPPRPHRLSLHDHSVRS